MKFKPGTYQTSELIDEGALQIGDGYRAKNTELASSGIPFARAGNINNGFQFDDADLFPIKDLGKVGDKISRVFDSVFTSKGTVGRIAYVKERTQQFVYSPQLCYWRSLDFEAIDPRFMNFWMNGREFKNQIDYLKGQTDMADYVSLRDQRKMTFTLPDIAAQRNIAEILGDLDDKIELNRQINQTLEQIALAIFKSWFVDFEPVKAKFKAKAAGRDPERAAMCAISGKSETELDQLPPEQYQQLTATAALFPDDLVESELELIPKGWEVSMLKDLTIKIGSGATPRGGSGVYLDEGTALIRSQNVYDSEFVWDGLARISDSAAKQLSNVEVKLEDVLLNITGASILRTCVVVPEVLPARVNQHVAIIRANPGIPARYLHLHLSQQKTKDYLMGLNAGASREAVTKGHIESVPTLHPHPELLSCFGAVTASIFDEAEQLASQSRTLATLRDTLLPKLLSGELSVADLPLEATA